ncbi:signal peptide peptidase-like isoform X2 [Papaver somniferum]|nr:signal peptide peptidase-like isoform X2 [Papaver somniferum]XP_026402346.1 signal peptide peptidase-like isoform X2 [Papaver somniferum]XP_026402347.1 signal peptide peptidase-like isoform X2 [Papaver somniferum]XP_026402349.1 signal peptide peptidase-like isoform X2 [Papaver somniferum]
MVSGVKSFDTPVKLLFPTADAARPYSMLGLGDVVIPGIFVSLALHFDESRKKHFGYFYSAIFGRMHLGYFYSAFFGYIIGICLMNCCQAAQPALLYIVPAVIGSLAVHCLWNGEVEELLAFDLSKDQELSSRQKRKHSRGEKDIGRISNISAVS